MKRLTITYIVIILTLLSLPFFIGQSYESILREQLEQFNKQSQYQLQINQYKRSWFTSKADLTLSINSQFPLFNNEINFKKRIQHGPFLWQEGSIDFGLTSSKIELTIPQDIEALIQQVSGEESEIIDISTYTDFRSITSINFNLKPISIKDSDYNLDIRELNSDITIHPYSTFTVSLDWHGLTLDDLKNSLQLDFDDLNISLTQHLVKGDSFTANALYDGEIELYLSQLNFQGPSPQNSITMNYLAFDIDSFIENDLIEFNAKLIIEQLELGALKQVLSNFLGLASIKNIDANIIQEINIATEQLANNSLLMTTKIQSLLPKLAEKNPIIKIDQLGAMAQQGEIYSDLNITIDPDTFEPSNPMTLLTSINAQAHAYAPEAFFNPLGMSEKIQQWVEQGFLTREQGELNAELSLSNGQTKINGQSISLNDF